MAEVLESLMQRVGLHNVLQAQRDVDRFGTCDNDSWSEDKARQYAHPERADFGDYIRKQGFNLD